jgi:hypothetical protein
MRLTPDAPWNWGQFHASDPNGRWNWRQIHASDPNGPWYWRQIHASSERAVELGTDPRFTPNRTLDPARDRARRRRLPLPHVDRTEQEPAQVCAGTTCLAPEHLDA